MSDEPTIKDVLDALAGVEKRLGTRINSLDTKIDDVEGRLTKQIRDTEKRLSNEIAGA